MTHKKEAPADQDRAGAIRSRFKTAIDIVAPYLVIIGFLAAVVAFDALVRWWLK